MDLRTVREADDKDPAVGATTPTNGPPVPGCEPEVPWDDPYEIAYILHPGSDRRVCDLPEADSEEGHRWRRPHAVVA